MLFCHQKKNTVKYCDGDQLKFVSAYKVPTTDKLRHDIALNKSIKSTSLSMLISATLS